MDDCWIYLVGRVTTEAAVVVEVEAAQELWVEAVDGRAMGSTCATLLAREFVDTEGILLDLSVSSIRLGLVNSCKGITSIDKEIYSFNIQFPMMLQNMTHQICKVE